MSGCEEAAPSAPPLLIDAPDASTALGPCGALNCPPRLLNLPDAVDALTYEPSSLQVQAEDADDPEDSLRYEASSRCDLSPQLDDGLLTWRCPAQPADCPLFVTVEDRLGARDIKTIHVRCVEGDSPRFVGRHPDSVQEDALIQYMPRCVPSNKRWTYSHSHEDTCGGYMLEGHYQWTPGDEDSPTCRVGLLCSEPGGGSASSLHEVRVAPSPDAPIIASMPLLIAPLDQESQRALEAADPDGDAISWRLDVSRCVAPVSVSEEGALTVRCGQEAERCEVEVVASDGALEDRATLSIWCGNNAPRFVGPTPPTQLDEHDLYTHTRVCEDADGDPLSLQLLDNSCGGSLRDGVYQLRAHEGLGGRTCSVTLRCSDGAEEVREQISLAIRELNSPPQIAGLAASLRGSRSSLRPSESSDFTVSDTDLPAQPIALDVETTCADPGAAFIVKNRERPGQLTLQLRCSAPQEQCEATLIVEDGVSSTRQIVQLTCENLPPSVSITAIDALHGAQGVTLNVETDPRDPETDPVTLDIIWSVAGQPIAVGDTAPDLLPGTRVEVAVTPRDPYTAGQTKRMTYLVPNHALVAAGDRHSCAIVEGALYCWGDNTHGQLGDGSTTSRWRPALVPGLTQDVQAVVAAAQHTCALRAGALYCWGDNAHGQLGDGAPAPLQTSPQQIFSAGVTDLAARGLHTCAVKSGELYCWGDNAHGQLGDGSTTSRATPTAIPLPAPAVRVGVGERHSCALDQSGVLSCWGANELGQLGDGTQLPRAAPGAPVARPPLSPGVVRAILAAGATTCIHFISGGSSCWGDNTHGQLGAQHLQPYALTPVNGPWALVLGLGARHRCAIDPTFFIPSQRFALSCTGANERGQSARTLSMMPRTGLPDYNERVNFAAVQGGAQHTCAAQDGVILCWGDNTYGQLGRPSLADSVATPLLSFRASPIGALISGDAATCATYAGDYQCWGDLAGSLRPRPIPLSAFQPSRQRIGLGAAHVCIADNGTLSCWGDNTYGQLGGTPFAPGASVNPLAGGVNRVAAGPRHTCAVKSGELYCWGDNAHGQLGDGTRQRRAVPTRIAQAGTSVTEVVVGDKNTCVIDAGAVYCWGDNARGQLGDGTRAATLTATGVLGMSSQASALTMRGEHVCALRAGTLYCWGAGDAGQLGDGLAQDQTSPQPVVGMTSGVTHVAAGGAHTCAIQHGALWCWGEGIPTGADTLDQTRTPRQIAGLDAAISDVVTGSAHTCAARDAQQVYCWGDGSSGQLGLNAELLDAPTPALFPPAP